jgi:hypothetical protein
MTAQSASKSPPIASKASAEALLNHIGETMVALVQVFEDETRLVRAGKLTAAAELAPEKTNLASVYVRDIEAMKENARFIKETLPELVEEMRAAHDSFREILGRNLRVVATAHSVAEGLIRGAAEEASRRQNPRGYHANGRTTPVKTTTRPVMVSRSS